MPRWPRSTTSRRPSSTTSPSSWIGLAAAFFDEHSALNLCVLGEDPFGRQPAGSARRGGGRPQAGPAAHRRDRRARGLPRALHQPFRAPAPAPDPRRRPRVPRADGGGHSGLPRPREGSSTSSWRAPRSASRSARRRPNGRGSGSAPSCCGWPPASRRRAAGRLIHADLQNLPIRQKLMLIALLTTGGALVLAGAALIYFDVTRFRAEMTERPRGPGRDRGQQQHGGLGIPGRRGRRRDPAGIAGAPGHRQRRRSTTATAGSSRATGNKGRPSCRPRPAPPTAAPSRGARRLPPRRSEGRAHRHGLPAQQPRRADGAHPGAGLTVGVVFLASGLVSLVLSSGLQRLDLAAYPGPRQTARAVSERQRLFAPRHQSRAPTRSGTSSTPSTACWSRSRSATPPCWRPRRSWNGGWRSARCELARRNEELGPEQPGAGRLRLHRLARPEGAAAGHPQLTPASCSRTTPTSSTTRGARSSRR